MREVAQQKKNILFLASSTRNTEIAELFGHTGNFIAPLGYAPELRQKSCVMCSRGFTRLN
jgi:hypothetical protein